MPADALAALRAYADCLSADPATAAAGRNLLKLLAPAGVWDWAKLLAAWPAARPHRLVPAVDPARCRELAERCRTAAGTVGKKRGLFGATDPAPIADVLTDAAAAFDSLTTAPPGPHLDRAAGLATRVEAALATLPDAGPARRLARIAAGTEWPAPPADANGDFVTLAKHLATAASSPGLFRTLLAEALPDLLAGGHIPPAAADALAAVAAAPPHEHGPLTAAFAAAYAGRGHGDWAFALARLGYAAAVQRDPGLLPPLDPFTLSVKPGYRPDPACTDVRYAADAAPLGTVLAVEQFAAPPGRSAVCVSLGRTPPPGWALLSAPADPAGLPPGPPRDALLAERGKAAAAFAAGATTTPAGATAWRKLLDTPAGGDWFHALAADPAGRGWLAAAAAWAGFACFPQPRTDGGFDWPAGVPLAQPGATFAADSAPPGSILSADRFAPDPAAARFAVAVASDAGPVAALWDKLADGPFHAVRAAFIPVIDHAARGTSPADADWVAAVTALADGDAAADRDGFAFVLDGLRTLAGAAGIELLPHGWAFAPGLPFPADPPPGLTAKPLFRAADPVGAMVRVRAFAVTRGAEILRPGEVVVSAGPPPAGVTHLDAAADVAPPGVREILLAALKDLRPAGLGGYLEQACVDLFAAFHDQTADVWAAADPAAAAGFADTLRAMLLDTFGLTEFHPDRYGDYPEGHVRIPPGARLTTGKVTRVLKPGLLDSAGNLRAAARVEAE